jgi:hypothetical protein
MRSWKTSSVLSAARIGRIEARQPPAMTLLPLYLPAFYESARQWHFKANICDQFSDILMRFTSR